MAFPSTFQDIQTAVIVKARLDPTNDLAKVKDWINQIYYEVCVESAAAMSSTTLNLVNGTSRYTIPSQVARLRQMFVTPAGQTSVGEQPPMRRTTLDTILQYRQNGGITGQAGSYCTHYALLGATQFEVWPTPGAADVITLYYVAFPTVLVANGDLPVIDEPYASKLLEFGALAEAGDFKGDPAQAEWAQDFDSWMGRYLNHLEQRAGEIPTVGHQWGDLRDVPGQTYGW